MQGALIFDNVRTPRGKLRDGKLQRVTPIRLAATPLKALRERSNLPADALEEVVLGCVVPVGEQGGDITRAAVLAAGLNQTVPGVQINRFCSSGLDAVNMASALVACGQYDLVAAGGVESMSRVPMGSDRGSWVSDPRETFATRYVPQGVAADAIATLAGLSREDVDAYAAQSQARAATAQAEGRFTRSIVPVRDLNGVEVLAKDDAPRPKTTAASLAALEPAFARMSVETGFTARMLLAHPEIETIAHVHTAGNSSGIVDGAAAILLGSAEAGTRHGLTPRARIVSAASVGVEPTTMLTGPTPASRMALEKAGMRASDIDLWEINEAFASVALSVMRDLDIDSNRVNVNGGAIALGHPLGASGAMLLGTALDELERRGLSTALITLCVAGGMGTATIIERV